MGKVIMGAEALDGYLTEDDLRHLNEMNALYQEAIENFAVLEKENGEKKKKAKIPKASSASFRSLKRK